MSYLTKWAKIDQYLEEFLANDDNQAYPKQINWLYEYEDIRLIGINGERIYMKAGSQKPQNIDEFIAEFPQETQAILHELRAVIKAAAPQAEEKISYGIPTFFLNGNLVHFSAYKTHIGFYPGSKGVEDFKDELASYTTSKGTIQFPLDQPIPLDLVRRIVESRVKDNLSKTVPQKMKKVG